MELQAAFEVFINGIAGVFAGIGVLYVAIRLNARIAGRETEKRE